MNWETKPLVEIGKWGSGGTPLSSRPEYYGGNIPWLIIEDLNDGIVTKSQRTITDLGLRNSSAKLVEPGTLLVAMYGSIGKLGIAGIRCATNQAIAFCKLDKTIIDVWYVFYYLLYCRPKLLFEGRGNTQQNISQTFLKDFTIPVPPLQEQRRIATILGKADRLRRLHRYKMDIGETFIQSVFLKTFYQNESSDWPKVKLSSLAIKGKTAIRTGPFGSQLKHSEFVDSGIRVLGIDNAVNNRFEWGKPRHITQTKYNKLKRYTVRPGDVLITIMGTLGRCAIVPENFPTAINTKHLCCITLDQDKCLPEYLKHCILTHPFVLNQMGVSERGAIMPGLNMGIIKDLFIPLPPIDVQNKFNALVVKNRGLQLVHQEALRKAEHLFQSLLHTTFQ